MKLINPILFGIAGGFYGLFFLCHILNGPVMPALIGLTFGVVFNGIAWISMWGEINEN